MIADLISQAMAHRHPIRVERFRNWSLLDLHGYVVGCSAEWVALQTLSDGVYVDGYDVVRMADITEIAEGAENGYVEKAVAALGRPEVDFALPEVARIQDVLREAGEHSPLICVHLEAEDDDPLLIGRVTSCNDATFHMMLINSAGVWTDASSEWSLSDITRVEFANRYSLALARFGDPYPLG